MSAGGRRSARNEPFSLWLAPLAALRVSYFLDARKRGPVAPARTFVAQLTGVHRCAGTTVTIRLVIMYLMP
jgi:hypothetical protein